MIKRDLFTFFFIRCLSIFVITGLSVSCPCAFSQGANTIQDLLSSEGKIFYGDAPNSILVVDYPSNLERIEEYLSVVDVPPAQVLIEARVVEVKLEGEHSLGINWSAFMDTPLVAGQWKIMGDADTDTISQSIPYKYTSYPPGSTDTSAQETPFSVTIFDENINFVIQTLANNFDTNILSAPRVTTINNREAEIKVVRELRWVVPQLEVEDTSVTITWNEGEGSPRDVGIILKVLPMITDDGNISMRLEPEVSEHVSDLELTTISGSTQVPYTIPIVDTRTATTNVIIGNGQTLIIGGLIKDKTIKGVSKVPFLGDIPGVGWAFKSQIETHEKSELLIFVSPTIITPEVVRKMERHERLGVGKWYMDERDVKTGELEKKEQKFLLTSIDSLEEELSHLRTLREGLSNAIEKEKKRMRNR